MGLLLEWSIVKTLLWQLGVIAHFLVTLWLVVRVIQQQRHQSVAIAWIAVLFALPVVGIIGSRNCLPDFHQPTVLNLISTVTPY